MKEKQNYDEHNGSIKQTSDNTIDVELLKAKIILAMIVGSMLIKADKENGTNYFEQAMSAAMKDVEHTPDSEKQ